MAPTTTRSLAKREAILTVATDLFLERGYDGVSVDAIVERVGGTKANIYTHFGGKEGLFRAIVENCCREILSPLSQIDPENLPLHEALMAIGHQFLSVILDSRTMALHRLVIAESTQFPELGRIYYETGPGATRRELANYLEQQQQLGKFKQCDAHRAATTFFNMLYGDIYLQLLLGIASSPAKSAIDSLAADAVETFLRAHT